MSLQSMNNSEKGKNQDRHILLGLLIILIVVVVIGLYMKSQERSSRDDMADTINLLNAYTDKVGRIEEDNRRIFGGGYP
jgi:hypothetical protein